MAINKPNNAIRIPCSLSDFFKYWFLFLEPFHNLTNREKDVVAAFSSAGKSPVLTQYLKEKEYEYLTPLIGDINEFMGEYREKVKSCYGTEDERKLMFRKILEYALEKNRVPTWENIEEMTHSKI